MSAHGPDDEQEPEPGEERPKPEEHILQTAEPFHPARDPDEEDEAGPVPPPPEPEDFDEPEAEPEPPAPPPPLAFEPPPRRRPGLFGRLARWMALALFFVLIGGPILATVFYRFVPVPLTPLMVMRAVEGKGLDHRWRPLDRISPALARAVVAAEDARFCEHRGFDMEAMKKAMASNERRPKRIRGGSTISQQTAKNVFLWPSRSYVRKGFEAWFTVLIETLWGKRRIMEVYLNSVEWGPGVYGAEAAARRNFGVGADALNPAQASRLAAILPSPLKWNAATPGRYVAKRSRRIGAASGTVRRDGLADCLR